MRIVPWIVGSCLVSMAAAPALAQSAAPPPPAPAGPEPKQPATSGPLVPVTSAGAIDPAVPAPGPAAPPNAQPNPTPTGPEPRATGPLAPAETRIAPTPSPATPAPTALEKATGAITAIIRPYGTLKPTVVASVGTLESFGNPNAVAETAAGNPVLATLPKDTRGTFQVQQTRLGFWVAEKSKARGQIEIDFVDFAKSSPTLASMPRLRIAKVEYEPIDHLVFGAGQDWDLYAPVNAFGTNLVGGFFESGNTAFMRQQLKGVYTSKTFEVGGAIGLQGANVTFKDAGQELSRVPSFALRAALVSGKSRVGVSAIATQLRHNPGLATERRAGSYAGNVYADLMPTKEIQIKAEGYIGRNMNNIGLLALSQGTATNDISELGGFVSARGQVAEQHAIYGTAGAAQVLNRSKVVADYAITPAATPTGTATRALSGTGPGIQFNMQLRVGYEYRPVKPLALVAEVFMFRTRHVFQAADVGRYNPMRNAPGATIAAMYTF